MTIDCDGQHEPSLIPQLIARAAEADLVSGSRYLQVFPGDSRPPEERRRINQLITERLNRQLGLHLTDAFCGFKAYRVPILGKFSLTETGYAMPLELWVQAVALGLKIVEMPVPLVYLDEARSFGGALDHGQTRLQVYEDVLDRAMAEAGIARGAGGGGSKRPCRLRCSKLPRLFSPRDEYLNENRTYDLCPRTTPSAAIGDAARERRGAGRPTHGRGRHPGGRERPVARYGRLCVARPLLGRPFAAGPRGTSRRGPNLDQRYRAADLPNLDPEGLVFLAGHQPELFHPGVWFKNFALGALARRHGAAAVNLVIDSDALKNTALLVPGGSPDDPRREAVPFDRPAPGSGPAGLSRNGGFSTRTCSPALAAARPGGSRRWFPTRSSNDSGRWCWSAPACRPVRLLPGPGAAPVGRPMGIANARSAAERGLRQRALSVVSGPLVCQHRALSRLLQPGRAGVSPGPPHSQRGPPCARSGYRGLVDRSPTVDLDGRATTASPRLRLPPRGSGGNPLVGAGHEILVSDRAGQELRLPLTMDGDATDAVGRLMTWNQQGTKIRSRALITTLWARLALSDLFLHGIGGAKYDRVTDRLIETFFGLRRRVSWSFPLPYICRGRQVPVVVGGQQVRARKIFTTFAANCAN